MQFSRLFFQDWTVIHFHDRNFFFSVVARMKYDSTDMNNVSTKCTLILLLISFLVIFTSVAWQIAQQIAEKPDDKCPVRRNTSRLPLRSIRGFVARFRAYKIRSRHSIPKYSLPKLTPSTLYLEYKWNQVSSNHLAYILYLMYIQFVIISSCVTV